ncbi:MAG TPA: nitrogenase component 1 [Pseudobacteroides sp.]|uniref:nitrogenase component 1 n=1 Tax=Pseudobacteroides sp. TaxID=1968840 RepID=UPI002F94BF83
MSNENSVNYGEAAEAPRYSCALGGAYSTAVAAFGTVPILHSGAGCGLGQLFGQQYAGGQNAGGPLGGTSTPCSCLMEEHVIFGGDDKLRNLVESSIDLMNGELFSVISGCVPSLIGDDVDSVVKEFSHKAPIFHVKAPGFSGNSYLGYDLFLESIINQLLEEVPKEKGLINIFGVVPYQHVFWKGTLSVLKDLLERLGLKVNVIFGELNALDNFKRIPAAELNLVLSPWNGHSVVKLLEEKFKTPYAVFPYVPVGPKETSDLLRILGDKLDISKDLLDDFIDKQEKIAYRYTEFLGDMVILGLPHAYYAVVADSPNAIGITKYLTNEIGYLADIVIITDNPPEEARDVIRKELTQNLDSTVKPDIIFEVDSYKIRQNLKDRNFIALFASSLEKHIAGEDFGAIQVSVAFPVYDRLIMDRNYAGYRGGLSLMEDFISKFAGPL